MPVITAVPANVVNQVIQTGDRQYRMLSAYDTIRRDLKKFYGFPNPFTAFSGTPWDAPQMPLPALLPAVGAKIFYVSNSGSNANAGYVTYDGTSASLETIPAAKATITSAYQVAAPGDFIMLECGGVWDEDITDMKDGVSNTNRTTLAWYGNPALGRPEIRRDGVIINDFGRSFKNLRYRGIKFAAHKHRVKTKWFTGSHNDSASLKNFSPVNVAYEDCVFDHVEPTPEANEHEDPGSNLEFLYCISNGHYSDVTSYSQSSRPSNFFIASINGLRIEGCVSDHGGWNRFVKNAAANQFVHNFYLQSSNSTSQRPAPGEDPVWTVIFRNNIVTRGASHGCQLRSGGLSEWNFFGRNALGQSFGYGADPLQPGDCALSQYNVVSELDTMYKGSSPGRRLNLCTTARWGLDIDAAQQANAADIVFQHNIVSMLNGATDILWDRGFGSLFTNAVYIPGGNATSINNKVYKVNSTTQGTDQGYPDPERTLATYHKSLVGPEGSFEGFVQCCLDRPLGCWNPAYSAEDGIVPYFHDGFGIEA